MEIELLLLIKLLTTCSSFNTLLLMDSWRSVFLANGTDLPSDSYTDTRKAMAGWDQRLSNDLENDIFISQLPDKSFSDLAAKSFGFNTVPISKVASSCLFPLNSLDDEEKEKEASSNFSCLASQELPRIDFKLSSLLGYSDSKESDSPAKKPRAANSCSQKPLCQVYGCNMDLTSSKDYHKRHRVCEIHSKTAMVIVSGIQQRFCQQCSRFHLLTEFDDGKRSCRRRLAGHNQRRRKPSFYFLPGRRHKVLHTSQGNNCLENSLDKDFSLMLPEAFPSGRLVKFKDESTCSIFSSNGKSSSRIYQWKPVSSSSEESSIWDIHEASRSTCALSLLSAKSQQVFGTQNKPNQMGSPLMDSGKNSSSYRKGSSTVDLLQLSLHLQRIEQQRNYTEVKHEYKDLYFPHS